MVLFLQSHDSFDKVAEFDPDECSIIVHSKQQESNKWQSAVAGWYSIVEGKLVAFFRIAHDLFLCTEENKYRIDPEVHAQIKGNETNRHFILEKHGEKLVSIQYRVPKSVIPPESDFTQTEPEHFDFFLFIRNILEDPGRRRFAMGFPRE